MNSENITPESIARVCTAFDRHISVHYSKEHPMIISSSEAASLLRRAMEIRVLKAIEKTGRWLIKLLQFENHYLPFRRTIFNRLNATLDWWDKPEIEQQKQRERSDGVLRFGDGPIQSSQPTTPKAKVVTPVKQITTKKTVQAPTPVQIIDLREHFQEVATDASWTITEEEAFDLFTKYDQPTLTETFGEIECWARMQEPAPSQQEVVDRLYFQLEMAHVLATA